MKLCTVKTLAVAIMLVGFQTAATAQICNPRPPPTNGCSSPWYVAAATGPSDALFASQCNSHDVCYGTLGAGSRDACDDAFRSAMKSKCDSAFIRWLQPAQWQTCRNIADGYYAAVRSQGQPYFDQGRSTGVTNSAQMGAMVNGGTCGTTPQQTAIYSSSLLSIVSNSFATYAHRAPTPYEFFNAINSPNLGGDATAWQTSVNNYAISVAALTPPLISFASSNSGSAITLMAQPVVPGITYTWRINGQTYTASSLNFGLPTTVQAAQGFLVAQAPSGLKNMVIVNQALPTIKVFEVALVSRSTEGLLDTTTWTVRNSGLVAAALTQLGITPNTEASVTYSSCPVGSIVAAGASCTVYTSNPPTCHDAMAYYLTATNAAGTAQSAEPTYTATLACGGS